MVLKRLVEINFKLDESDDNDSNNNHEAEASKLSCLRLPKHLISALETEESFIKHLLNAICISLFLTAALRGRRWFLAFSQMQLLGLRGSVSCLKS